jgi:O-antigen ligase
MASPTLGPVTTVKDKARAATAPETTSTAWGHVFGVAALLVVTVFIPPWAEAFTMPKVIVVTMLGLATIPLLWLRRASALAQRIPLLLLAGFTLLALLSQLFSGAPQAISLWGEWFRRSGTLTVVALALVLAAAAVLTRPEVRALLAWLVWAGVPATIYGLIQLVGADPFNWNNQGWIVSTFGNPNFAAAGLSMLALLTAGLALTKTYGTTWRILMAPLAALEGLLALQTGSSQAIFALAAGVGAGALVWLLRWDDAKRGIALIGVAIAVAIGFVLTLMALLGSGPLVPFVSSDTLMFRQWYWGAAIGMAGSHPILGVGPDGYGRFYGEFRSEEAAEMFTLGASAAHDVPLQWAATLGIPAVVLYVALMITVAVVVIRRLWVQGPAASPLALPLLAVWAAYQVQSLVSIDATSIAFLGWLMTGLLLAVTRADGVGNPATSVGAWIAAGALAVVGLLAWLPALLASNASQSVVQGTTEQDVFNGISLVEGTTLPCEPSVRVGQWLIQVAPAQQTVDAVLAGARADDRCYGLVNAAADFAIQLGQVPDAVDLAQQAVAIDPLNYSTWLLVARAQDLAGDRGAGQAALERAAELAPGNGEVVAIAEQLRLTLPDPTS